MLNLFANLQKPEYLFRPRQIGRRLLRGLRRPAGAFESIELPWGLPLRVNVDDGIGKQVRLLGIFELAVSEVLWRLAETGELAIDVGSNIGHMASLLAARVGAAGRVLGFEPHPALFAELQENGRRWGAFAVGRVDLHPIALADRAGAGFLNVPTDFAVNRGIARLGSEDAGNGASVRVPLQRLDYFLAATGAAAVVKVDVEGYELDVLHGAGEFITGRRIRDIVFEEHQPYPSPASAFLEASGYAVFAIRQTLLGPRLCAPTSAEIGLRPWETPNFLATLQPERAVEKLRPWGWQCLRRAVVPHAAPC
jgi:FkbM family methyltransferase